MKQILVGIVLFMTAACSGSSDDDASSGGKGGGGGSGGGGGTSGGGSTMRCGTHTPTPLYPSDKILTGAAADDASVFFLESGKTLRSIPKEGGSAETLAAIPTVGIPDAFTRIYVDGTKLYLSDAATLWSLDKAGGTPVALATTDSFTGMDPIFTFDDDFIYFGDNVSTDAGEPDGTLNKVKKSGGTKTVLATGLAAPGSVALDGSDLYFINDGTMDLEFDSLYNSSLATIPKAGGTVRTLYAQNSDKNAISPSEGDLLVTSSTVYFSSINADNFRSYGEYSLPKSGGTPADFSDCPTLGAFIQGDAMYANCGDRIAKFDLATGDETDLVCFPVLEGAYAMTHDAKTIYYTKHEPDTGSSDTNYTIYSVPIE
jgi:hypothetical protein